MLYIDNFCLSNYLFVCPPICLSDMYILELLINNQVLFGVARN